MPILTGGVIALSASPLPSTNMYAYMKAAIVVFALIMVWIIYATVRVGIVAARTIRARPGDAHEAADTPEAADPHHEAASTPESVSDPLSAQSGELLRVPIPDSIRYHSLVPVIESIESSREIAARGAELAPSVVPSATDLTFAVPGEGRDYRVSILPLSCECSWWGHRGSPTSVCKHIVAVTAYVLDSIK